MEVIIHQDIGVQFCMEEIQTRGKDLKKSNPVGITTENRLLLISPTGYMIPGAGVLDADRSCHD